MHPVHESWQHSSIRSPGAMITGPDSVLNVVLLTHILSSQISRQNGTNSLGQLTL